MKLRNCVLGITVLLMLAAAASAQRIAGVWRLDEIKTTGEKAQTYKKSQPSMYVFTKRHYSITRVDSDQPRSTDDPAKMTTEQLIDTYLESFVANAGTYEMKGGTLTTHIMVAKNPAFMSGGKWVSFDVKFAGNQVMLTSKETESGPAKNPATYTLTRVE